MVTNHEIYHDLYTNKDKFIILVTGGRGCEHPNTPIMMSDASVKRIKDVKIGEYVMGDDWLPRKVVDVIRGRSMMYKVKQIGADDYIVSDSHILCLYNTESQKVDEVPLFKYMESPNGYKGIVKHDGQIRYTDISLIQVGEGEYCGITIDGNHRYLAADGTVKRNSGKSFSVSTFIERLTFELGVDEETGKKIAHQILYTRYTMVSASISVIPEFMEKVDADGTTKYFHTTKTDVVNKMTKSRIMFRGLLTSSGVQTAKLKSIHGITTFVVDEAEEWVSEKEFETIMLSIRQKGLQNRIIIIMNPTDSNHFIYQKYIKDTHKIVDYDGVPVQISTHPNVLHIHTSYLDNKDYLSEQFLNEANDMKEKHPEKYAHLFMGQWSDVAEGAVFKKWGIVKEFPSYAQKVAIGIDWGYTQDVTAMVKCGIVDNRLYLQELCFKQGMLTSDIIAELKKYNLFCYADSADPRLIDEVALGGIIIYPVQKGAGSIIAGIEKMLDMEIFVTEDSTNLQHELRNYVWAKDKFGNYINEPEDAYNHCFVGGTLITTNRGDIPISKVKVGDMVLNSDGWHKVLKVFDNGIKKVYKYNINGISVTCTNNHNIKTESGWKHISELRDGDRIYLLKNFKEELSGQDNLLMQDFAVQSVSEFTIAEENEERVFDLEVEGVHEYFANGILVHNCIDASRYYVLAKLLGQVMKPRPLQRKGDYGIF